MRIPYYMYIKFIRISRVEYVVSDSFPFYAIGFCILVIRFRYTINFSSAEARSKIIPHSSLIFDIEFAIYWNGYT